MTRRGAPWTIGFDAGLPFAAADDERRKQGDPRRSVLQRYPTREAYLGKMTEAALALHREGFLLAEDVAALLTAAAQRRSWDEQ